MRLSHQFTLLILLSIALALCSNMPSMALELTDELGREIELEGVPERLVSLAPNITEIIFALGVGDRLVGVTEYCNYPPQAKKIKSIGGFIDPNLELILTLKPDLIIGTADGNYRWMIQRMEKVGLKVYIINPSNFSQLFSTIRDMGSLLGVKEAGARLADSLKRRMDRIAASVKENIGSSKPTVFLQISHQPLVTASDGTMVNTLIEKAGGINIAKGLDVRYPQFSIEEVLRRNPDIILVMGNNNEQQKNLAVKKWEEYKEINAVKNGQIFMIDQDIYSRTSPRCLDALQELHYIFLECKKTNNGTYMFLNLSKGDIAALSLSDNRIIRRSGDGHRIKALP